MLDKVRSHITHWANTTLSYAGKVALINSVIFGIHNFWGASVLLPKGIVKKIHKMCKDFLWGIEDGQRRMVFKSWESLCRPRKEGGVDIKEILSCNKEQMMGWIKKIETDAPNIWVKWVNAYILKSVSFWNFQITTVHSWFWGNIITCRDNLVLYTGGIQQAKQLLLTPEYKSLIYECLRSKGPVQSYHRTLGEPLNIPKHSFIGLLAAENRLPTVDNLCQRGMVLVNRCVLCESAAETAAHLFFECPYSAEVWFQVSRWMQVPIQASLSQTLRWYKLHNRGSALVKRQRRCLLLCAIYLLWKERNRRIFKGLSSTPAALIWQI
ncbi:uncharacterized protein LOC141614600 [Silene latifolia]|uniref:uncharacterized protein LOC141614600 n=1 Tax=Silene latifolia TaxID=37657 RepID=UPI003D77DA8E